MTNFVGTGKRLTQGDIGDAARTIGIETAVLLAFLEVEAAGRGFDNFNRLKMLFEPHIFFRELGAGIKRDTAAGRGLAYKDWKAGNYPADSYPRLIKAIEIDRNAAFRSASWGLPQIMGFNHTDAGFANAEAMVMTMKQGEREQLFAMVTLMRKWNMVAMLTGRDFTKADSWRPAAAKYNGASYATNGYHTKLATAYRKHAHVTPTPYIPAIPADDKLLQWGNKGEAVRNMQGDLALLGYKFALGIDGRFGNETLRIVKEFQTEHGLKVDGIAGRKTLATLSASVIEATADRSPVTPAPVGGAGLIAKLIAAILAAFAKG